MAGDIVVVVAVEDVLAGRTRVTLAESWQPRWRARACAGTTEAAARTCEGSEEVAEASSSARLWETGASMIWWACADENDAVGVVRLHQRRLRSPRQALRGSPPSGVRLWQLTPQIWNNRMADIRNTENRVV